MSETVAHPTPKTYWIIAFTLAAVTAVEIAVAYVEQLSDFFPVILISLGAVKFGIVVAFFMHLKFEKPLMKNLFLVGVFGAIVLFVVVLATFRAL
jgi:cytochrome c oxidase subunit 4